jgi:phosphatidylinositol-4-phosphate 3-kinase
MNCNSLFSRDRVPFILNKQMLYVISGGETAQDKIHRFVELCCQAFDTLRQNSSLFLLLLSHLCSSNVPNLNYDAVRFVYDRLLPSLDYATSKANFTQLIFMSSDSTWPMWNNVIHKVAHAVSSSTSSNVTLHGPTLSFVPETFTVNTDGKVQSAQRNVLNRLNIIYTN